MTELYINEQAAVLPSSIEFSMVEENPFLTKNGEFSFDIELSLHEPQNARIFGAINRWNIPKNTGDFQFILIVDARVWMRGTIDVLSVTESKVSIQLLSGNSEINYFINSDKYIRDLDLGQEPELNETDAVRTWMEPEIFHRHFVCIPVSVDGMILNNIKIASAPNGYFYIAENVTMMPYLKYYIEAIPAILGYTIAENQLQNEPVYERLFICHGIRSWKYADILGGFTVRDFLTEVEKFFNISFVIDKGTKTLRIIRNYNQTNTEQTFIPDKNVLEEYTAEFDKDNEIDTLDYDAVRYSFLDENERKYMDISPEVLKNVVIEEYETYSDLKAALGDNLQPCYNNRKIYHVLYNNVLGFNQIQSDNYYIADKNRYNPSYYELRLVHNFRTVGDTSGNVIELKITPVPFAFGTFNLYVDGADGVTYSFNIPSLSGLTDVTDDDDTGVIDMIENGIEDAVGLSSLIPVAVFAGKSLMPVSSWADDVLYNYWPSAMLPFIVVDNWPQKIEYFAGAYDREKLNLPSSVWPNQETYITQAIIDSWTPAQKQQANANIENFLKYSLRMSGLTGFFAQNYSKNRNINSKEIWTISFIRQQPVDVRSLFVIRNKKFICLSIETKINADGALPIVVGKFLPVD